jgi:hypothetical protein
MYIISLLLPITRVPKFSNLLIGSGSVSDEPLPISADSYPLQEVLQPTTIKKNTTVRKISQ